MTSKQAEKLEVASHSQISPHLQMCCLILSAKSSYQKAEEDIFVLTGRSVSHSTQQKLVHRQEFKLPILAAEQSVEELSVDGGNIRLRTPLGEPSRYQNYKAISLHEQAVGAFFQQNEGLLNWVNQQPLSPPFYCLGDGHDGIWNIITQIGQKEQRIEILDWYHLIENLHKVGGSNQRLETVENLLWVGNVDAAIAEFKDWDAQAPNNFVKYLEKHRTRIVNYSYYQAEGISIGSGSVESLVKQIGARVQLAGAQWNTENVAQVLLHRSAYLNGQLSSITKRV